MSKRSKACDISPKVRRAVYERDDGLCVICHKQGFPNAHFIPRSDRGLGIEENIVSLCLTCHSDYDGTKREEYGQRIEDYLTSQYSDWDKSKLQFRKYDYGI